MSSLEKRLVNFNKYCRDPRLIIAINNAYLCRMYKLTEELLAAHGY